MTPPPPYLLRSCFSSPFLGRGLVFVYLGYFFRGIIYFSVFSCCGVCAAVLGEELGPCLGFVHSEQYVKPSLVCDLMELYRYLVDDFVIQFSQGLKPRDFVVKGERTTRKRWGKREYPNGTRTRELERGLDGMFSGWIDVPRIRHGSRQTLETLINEEALLLAKYLRDENNQWIPRTAEV